MAHKADIKVSLQLRDHGYLWYPVHTIGPSVGPSDGLSDGPTDGPTVLPSVWTKSRTVRRTVRRRSYRVNRLLLFITHFLSSTRHAKVLWNFSIVSNSRMSISAARGAWDGKSRHHSNEQSRLSFRAPLTFAICLQPFRSINACFSYRLWLNTKFGRDETFETGNEVTIWTYPEFCVVGRWSFPLSLTVSHKGPEIWIFSGND